MMQKCDIVIPVYKSPEWVKLCVYAIFKTTKLDLLGKVILINDCDDEYTNNCLNNLKEKYGNKIILEKNHKNLGFVGSTNNGMKLSKSDYVLLLNTDCILTKNAIEKMMNAMSKNKKIGLLSPISSNAANLTLEMFKGFNYSTMNDLLESKFSGKIFDACTVVGNCLMISRECINKVGYLDTAYGLGYGEETDYQFQAMEKGFEAKVLIDTYVFHKSEASFGTSKEKQERLKKNRDLFFSRWKNQYDKAMEKYKNNDPIEYILNNISEEDKIPKIDNAIYLSGIIQNAGGVHVVVDMVNYLAINGVNANIIYDYYGDYKEIMLFNPLSSNSIENAKIKNIIATLWNSVFMAKKIADKQKAKLLYFVQGNECLFENANVYGVVDTTYKIVDSIFTISKYLSDEIKEKTNLSSTIISNGINYDLIFKNEKKKKINTITFVLRNNVMKGDWILIDILKKIDIKFKGLNINVVYMSDLIEFPEITNNSVNKILGPVSRKEIIEILQNSDIYIDASLNEGFGLTPLEAMACGNVPIVSNSFGINDYIKDKKNGFIISEVNSANKYIEKLEILLNDKDKYDDMMKNIVNTCQKFDYEKSVEKYIEYFKNVKPYVKKLKLSEKDKEIIEKYSYQQNSINKKRKLYYIAKLIPKSLKNKLKKIITYLYNSFSH